jgi:formate dehydrogenase maturation protein FdhE
MGDLSKLGDEKIKIGTELVKLSDEQKKELSEAIKKAAADIKDNVKDALTFKTFIENPLDAFGQITSAIQQLRDKANEAAAIGDAKLNETLLSQAEDLQKKLDGLLKEQKTKQAEEDKKKAAETAQAQAQRRSDIEKLFIRKIEEEKIASNKRIAANTELLDALKREEAAVVREPAQT